MQAYKINNKKYYLISELMTEYPTLFKKCKNGREFVNKENISSNKYIFARSTERGFTVTDGMSKKFDKIFILKDWFDENYVDDVESEEEIEEIKEDIGEAPAIIELDDHEKFVDNYDNIVEIEVRGERDHEKCYFRVKDIMEGFGIKYLNDVIINKNRSGYIHDIHYKYFYCHASVKDRSGNKNEKIKKIKELYLTYLGLLRVFFVSRKETADKFVKWASKTLFTAQMGTLTEKRKLASSVLGVSPSEVKAVFSKTSFVLPVIYLFTLGTVKDLRKTLNIDGKHKDDKIIAKIGVTKDIERRTREHEKEYGRLKNVNMELVHYEYIDSQYIFSSETDLKDIIKGLNLNLEHEKYDELIIFNKTQLPMIKKQYQQIGKSYIGHIAELVTKIKTLESERELTKEKHVNELMKEKYHNDLMKEKHENEMMKKDIEIMKRDMEIMKMSKQKK
uniref:Bro-N domain-containing protein n=1 Tax=viral metagenome TaxID=1070528 RepID=A0A6C0C9C7_9ZZZZ